jgi:hypothetical protein
MGAKQPGPDGNNLRSPSVGDRSLVNTVGQRKPARRHKEYAFSQPFGFLEISNYLETSLFYEGAIYVYRTSFHNEFPQQYP